MANFLEYIPWRSYNWFGRLILIVFGIVFIPVTTVSSVLFLNSSFDCHNEIISKTKESSLLKSIESTCFRQYKDGLTFKDAAFLTVVLNFAIVLIWSIVYGYYVKHRIEPNDTDSPIENRNEQSQPLHVDYSEGTPQSDNVAFNFSSFSIYIVYLVVRLIILSVFIVLLFHAKFPIYYTCKRRPTLKEISSLNNTISTIDCENLNADKKETLIKAVLSVDFIVITLTILELCYLTYKAWTDNSFKKENKFCTVYLNFVLLQKPKEWLEENINDLYTNKFFEIHDNFGDENKERQNLDNIYVNVILQAKRQLKNAFPETFNRHEIFHSYLKVRNDVKKLTRVNEIFTPIPGEQSTSCPNSILVIGRPGIGKTMLTKKLIYEWKNNRDGYWQDKLVILVRCRDLETCDTTLEDMLKRRDGLKDKHYSQVYKFIITYPKQTVIIIDGLDELFLNRLELHETKNPVFKLIKKLVEGETLSDAIVLVTSRPTAEHAYGCLKFDRTVEILGFFEDQIKEYVDKFCGKDKNTAKSIYEHIDTSLELKSLCYIPVNSYIVCLTLKESLICKAEDIPKTITKLYNRAIKVLLWMHHPLCKSGKIPRENDYLIIPLHPELKNDIDKIKDIAVSGITKGNLIFEKSSNSAFHEVANCGIFHRIQDAKRLQYCFLHLTIQEFLAAQCIVDEWSKIPLFLDYNKRDPKWQLVIQFVAGLIGDMKRSGSIRDTKTLEDVEERFKDWISNLFSENGDKVLGFLGVKCLYELQDKDFMSSACTELKNFSQILKINYVSFTPVDSNALFEFLSECEHITRVSFEDCKFLDNHSFLPLKNYLSSGRAEILINLKFCRCTLGNLFSKHFIEALKSENCKLTKLELLVAKIGDEGAKSLIEALKSETCKLTKLHLNSSNIGDEGAKYLSEALKSENCKLTNLSPDRNQIGDEGAKYLSEALKSYNCKLTSLNLNSNQIGDEGAKYLSEALKSYNCKLTSLNLNSNQIGHECEKYLSEASKSENWKLSQLYIKGYNIRKNV
ncbi:NACHT, LRR and PYD domains-containing protein 12-like isoform X2 [Xenia sp. Carnegie-2017]|uniref:NACHT, LRR and PYD domains-containing protein 12-like isoform X2 n=1 Tax=Xenia sp. Carnegie-2017 TaxID=2897299 RepID=UPI001F03E55C|nr:NACHT, LRR and PYD domains-containing protein 12-like isoform X2 [Xenia sp. Carnegie-2017]